MKCSDIQFELSLYSDPDDGATSAGLREHLDQCPVCRAQLSQFRSLRNDLLHLGRPALLPTTVRKLRETVLTEARIGPGFFEPAIRNLLEFQLIPYGIGAAASVIIGLGFLSMMFSGIFQPELSVAKRDGTGSAVMLTSSFDPYRIANPDDISANDLVRSRMSVAGESPSVNPQGALIALTKSLVRGEMRDDEVVIVADVFANGLARISEVVEPSDDHQIVQELRKAMDTDPASAPFVPSSVENRPESVRVVFMMQSVNVSTRRHRGRTRL